MARRNLTPAAVVATAALVADRDGYAAVTASSVARELGVQPASLYTHVTDLRALLDALHALALSELADEAGASVAGRSGRDALEGFAGAHRRYAREYPGRWAALQGTAAPSTVASEGAVRLGRLTVAVLRGYELPAEQVAHAARFLGASINGFLALERAGAFDERDPRPAASSWEPMVEAVDRALRTWPRPEGDPA
jgi:AcrR family transcriptional regulator